MVVCPSADRGSIRIRVSMAVLVAKTLPEDEATELFFDEERGLLCQMGVPLKEIVSTKKKARDWVRKMKILSESEAIEISKKQIKTTWDYYEIPKEIQDRVVWE